MGDQKKSMCTVYTCINEGVYNIEIDLDNRSPSAQMSMCKPCFMKAMGCVECLVCHQPKAKPGDDKYNNIQCECDRKSTEGSKYQLGLTYRDISELAQE